MEAFETERALAREAAHAAGRLCLAVRQEMLGHSESMAKAGDEPVTVADFGAQAVILNAIAHYFPHDAVYAEERAADFDALANDSQRLYVARHVARALGRPLSLDAIRSRLDHGRGVDSDRVWAIDPIDGTKGFLRGDQFAVAIGLLVEGAVTVAVLACPMLPLDTPPASEASPQGEPGVVFIAVRGRGAEVEPLRGGAARPARVSEIADASAARLVESVESRHTDHAFSAGVMAAAGIGGETVRMDSQAKYGAVADGRAEIYIRYSPDRARPERVWDHAAGALVIQEAGGTVTDLDGKALDFGQGLTLGQNRGILATNGFIHQTVLAAIQRVEGRVSE